MNIAFDLLIDKSKIPYPLLLLADETVEAIDKYIFDSDIYLIKNLENTIGVFCLQKINQEIVELKNIAINQDFQNQNIGSKAIDFIKKITQKNFKILIVGTPDIALKQIHFYQKNGFEKYDVRKNFFINNYTKPIIEDGIILKDMILLKYQLK